MAGRRTPWCKIRALFFLLIAISGSVIMLATYITSYYVTNDTDSMTSRFEHAHPGTRSATTDFQLTTTSAAPRFQTPPVDPAFGGSIPVGKLTDLDPNHSYLKHRMMGRLGNLLFQTASSFCVAAKYNLSLLFSYKPHMEDMDFFTTGKAIVLRLEDYKKLGESTRPWRRAWEKSCCGFNEEVLHLSPGVNYSLRGYLQSWKYFQFCLKEDVLSVVSFKQEIVWEAEAIVKRLKETFPGRILVGIHVRMEDHGRARDTRKGRKLAPPEYYVRAMTYFTRKFNNVTFVVVTSPDSQRWFHDHVALTSAWVVHTMNRTERAAVDLEVMSRLDHVIISVGTFGWWSAYKNVGTVVYFKEFFQPGSRFGSQFPHGGRDYACPHWVPL